MHHVTTKPGRTVGILALTAGLLVAAGVAGQCYTVLLGREDSYGFIGLFDVAREHSVPTFFSVSLFLCSALLLATIASIKRQAKDAYGAHWTMLSLLSLYMACDAAANIHALWMKPTTQVLAGLGIQLGDGSFVAWVIPGLVLTVVVGLFYLSFLMDLVGRIRMLFVLAGAIFIAGAVGVEMVQGTQVGIFGGSADVPQNVIFTRNMIFTAQRTIEMAAVILFIFGLLKYLEMEVVAFEWRVGSGMPFPRANTPLEQSAGTSAPAPTPNPVRSNNGTDGTTTPSLAEPRTTVLGSTLRKSEKRRRSKQRRWFTRRD